MKDSVANAKHYALKLLHYRDRSEKELRERLKLKGFSDNTTHHIIEELKDSGLIDDSSLARSLEEAARNQKMLGNRGVEYFLKKRGIHQNVISELFIHDSEEIQRAMQLISLKMRMFKHLPPDKRTNKIRGFLMRRGYSFETIKRVLSQLDKNNDYTP